MKKNLFAAIIVLAISGFFTIKVQAQQVPYKIDSVQAFLFYNSNKSASDTNVAGRLSGNIIDLKGGALWNTPIGAGYADGVSNQVLVVVKIRGNPEKAPERIIRLTASFRHKPFFQQSQQFSIFDNASGYYAAFLLYNTGCSEIKLKAEIIHSYVKSGKKIQKTESLQEKDMLFHCGE